MVWSSTLSNDYDDRTRVEQEISELQWDEERNAQHSSIESREFIEIGIHDQVADLDEPFITAVLVNDLYTWVVKYQGDKTIKRSSYRSPQNIFFFPVITPNNLYFECSGPDQWRVFFLGKISELLESKHKDLFNHLQKVAKDKIIIVMNNADCPKGYEGGKGLSAHFCTEVIARVEDGQIIYPKTYFRYP